MKCETCERVFDDFVTQLSLTGYPNVLACPHCAITINEGVFIGMEYIESSYYEKMVVLTAMEQQTLFNLYMKVAEEQNFEPEVESPGDIDNPHAYDHVAYHVEELAPDCRELTQIGHLFWKEDMNVYNV